MGGGGFSPAKPLAKKRNRGNQTERPRRFPIIKAGKDDAMLIWGYKSGIWRVYGYIYRSWLYVWEK